MPNIKTKVQEKEEMVERMGVFFEQRGLTPMHGRVFAYLLLSEPPYKDFYEIQNFLKASKSAISNALKFLMDKNLVRYMTFSGDRKRYFQVDMDGWLETVKYEIRETTTAKDIIQDVLNTRVDSKHLDFNEKLETMISFYKEMIDVFDVFINKWEKENE